MSRPMHFRINRDDEDSFDKVYRTYHRCPQGAKNGDDILEYWPYAALAGMPRGVAAPVESTVPCPACGLIVTAWFEWGGAIHLLG